MIETRLPLLEIRGRKLLPVIQGGMGVGVSAHGLAAAVAREGAVGTVASVELRRLHPDIMERLGRSRDHEAMVAGNLEALEREIREAKRLSAPDGYVAVNVMRAVKHYRELVLRACRSGADALLVGAGLPFDLPDIVRDFPDVALIPILSEERGVRAVVKRWLQRGRAPDAIVLEHPRYAGGHLGATRAEEIASPRFDFARVLGAVRDVLDQLGLGTRPIPLIPAGGVNSHERILRLFELGAQAVQVGTPFAVTVECDAHPEFKRVLATATPETIVTFQSAAGLPARAVLTPWLRRYLAREQRLRGRADPQRAVCARNLQCLTHCGLKDGNAAAGQFCLETQLAAAHRGDVEHGLFFRGAEALPFGSEIRPVRDLLTYLLTGMRPAPGLP